MTTEAKQAEHQAPATPVPTAEPQTVATDTVGRVWNGPVTTGGTEA